MNFHRSGAWNKTGKVKRTDEGCYYYSWKTHFSLEKKVVVEAEPRWSKQVPQPLFMMVCAQRVLTVHSYWSSDTGLAEHHEGSGYVWNPCPLESHVFPLNYLKSVSKDSAQRDCICPFQTQLEISQVLARGICLPLHHIHHYTTGRYYTAHMFTQSCCMPFKPRVPQNMAALPDFSVFLGCKLRARLG